MQTGYLYLAVNSNLRYSLSELYVSLGPLGTNYIEKTLPSNSYVELI